ncbi:hypothetical protein Cva_00901 [Caedimonas varicaedens]|uniref:Uncharacterized protein n=1 Tax=Caedimonas varicaedens TaxID=1629334 RepID=A0A0K8MCQ2_9PROT|nr:hypothetical protein Cva_00901 [Caedimonas varicaedens]
MTQSIKKPPATSAYKFRVAIAAWKGDKTVSSFLSFLHFVSAFIGLR